MCLIKPMFTVCVFFCFFFFFNDTATTEIYTLSLHDALPISPAPRRGAPCGPLDQTALGLVLPALAGWPLPAVGPPPRPSASPPAPLVQPARAASSATAAAARAGRLMCLLRPRAASAAPTTPRPPIAQQRLVGHLTSQVPV